MMGYGGDFGWMVGFGGLGMFVGLLFWVALIVLGCVGSQWAIRPHARRHMD